jgi:Cft2 family RNA processing exonuclease
MLRAFKNGNEFPVQVLLKDGVHIKGTVLWLDSSSAGELNFISRARFNNFVKSSRKILCTSRTARLLDLKSLKKPPLLATFNRAFSLGSLNLELFPAGLIPGSSQLMIEWQEKKIVYAGELGNRSTLFAEKQEIRKCDMLILNARNIIMDEPMIKARQAASEICSFAQILLSKGFRPVFLVDPFGEAQDLIKILGEASFRLKVHRKIQRINRIYEDFGIHLRNFSIMTDRLKKDDIVILPEHDSPVMMLKGLSRAKIFTSDQKLSLNKKEKGSKNGHILGMMLGSWINKDIVLDYVSACKPSFVHVFSGNAEKVVSFLKKNRINAAVLHESNKQLELF